MTWPITDTPPHSRGRKPTRAVHRSCPSKMRAQGMPGAWTAPAASRAKQKSTRDSHHGSAERAGIPCANGFNGLLRALPGDRAFLSPSPARCESIVASLTPASRRQNHTTSPSASVRFVSRTVASTASRPNVRDDRDTPLMRDGMAGMMLVIWVRREANYFCSKDWTVDSALIGFGKLDFWCTRILRHSGSMR
jgi:hypothetical protein